MNSSESSTAFSVVIPLYNRAEKVVRAIESAQCQALKPLEIIVVDDGSTDSGPEVIRDQFPEVRLIRQPNSGPGPARNRGITAARGDWVAFLDSDDIWHPDHLRELDQAVKAFPDAGLVFTRYVTMSEPANQHAAEGGPGALSYVDYFYANAPAFTSSTAVSSSVATEVGGFKNRMSGEDKEFWARVACYHPVAMSTAVTAIYVATGDGLSAVAERQGHHASGDLADVSFSLATVSRVLKCPPRNLYAHPQSLRWFLNYRLSIKVRTSLLKGEIDYAKSLRRFFVRPYGHRTRGLVVALRLPAPLLRVVIEIRRQRHRIQILFKNST